MEKGSIRGRTALVTGAAKRIGREISLLLAREGANVIVHYKRSQTEAESLCGELTKLGVNAWSLKADFSVPSEYESLIDRSLELSSGQLDILINNASIFPKEDLETLSFNSMVQNLEINAWVPFLLSRKFAERVGSGKIVNLLDSRTIGYDWNHVGYILSKHVLTVLTEMTALAFAPKISVNGVAPGLILPPPGEPESYLDKMVNTVPLRRHGEPFDVAQAVLYLLKASFVTGNVIYVDGGRHLKEYT